MTSPRHKGLGVLPKGCRWQNPSLSAPKEQESSASEGRWSVCMDDARNKGPETGRVMHDDYEIDS